MCLAGRDQLVSQGLHLLQFVSTHLVWLGFLHLPDVGLQAQGHGLGQVAGIVVVLRYPAVDLVELQEDARRTLVVAVVVLLGARRPRLDVHIAHLTLRRRLVVVAVVDVLATAGSEAGHLVNWKR